MRDYENQVYALREFDDSEKFLVAFSNEKLIRDPATQGIYAHIRYVKNMYDSL
jgi:hypothetical protein